MIRDLKWFNSLRKRDFDNGAVLNEISAVFKERERLQTMIGQLENDLGTISDKLGSVIRTIPSGTLSRTYIEAIDDANRIAFLAWRSIITKR